MFLNHLLSVLAGPMDAPWVDNTSFHLLEGIHSVFPLLLLHSFLEFTEN